MSEEKFEIEGIVEAVDEEFYTTKAGKKVAMVKLTNGEVFLDWKGRIKEIPKVGQKVRITYGDWTPRHIPFKRHHVIESLEVIEYTMTAEMLMEIRASLRQIRQMLSEIVETTAKKG